MQRFLIFALLISFNSAWAENCSYSIKKNAFKVEWTAFKTPLKVGVKGSFDKLGVKSDQKGTSLKDLLSNINFNIDGQSVNTNNKDRDKKISTYFFEPMGNTITGKLVSYDKKIINMSLTMNGVTKIVPLKAEIKNNEIIAQGHIDVLDFSLEKSLAGINKACLELHEGKTWSDVSLQLSAKFKKTCK